MQDLIANLQLQLYNDELLIHMWTDISDSWNEVADRWEYIGKNVTVNDRVLFLS